MKFVLFCLQFYKLIKFIYLFKYLRIIRDYFSEKFYIESHSLYLKFTHRIRKKDVLGLFSYDFYLKNIFSDRKSYFILYGNGQSKIDYIEITIKVWINNMIKSDTIIVKNFGLNHEKCTDLYQIPEYYFVYYNGISYQRYDKVEIYLDSIVINNEILEKDYLFYVGYPCHFEFLNRTYYKIGDQFYNINHLENGKINLRNIISNHLFNPLNILDYDSVYNRHRLSIIEKFNILLFKLITAEKILSFIFWTLMIFRIMKLDKDSYPIFIFKLKEKIYILKGSASQGR